MAQDMGTQGEVLYSERHRVKWLLPILALSWVGLVAGVIVASLSGSGSVAVILAIVTVVIVVLYLLFDPLSFFVTADEVAFGFIGWKKVYPRSALVSCESYELTFSNCMGYGVRVGRDGTTAFNTRNGPGVKMVFDGAKRPYVVSVDEPEVVCMILEGKRH
jgi:hypothetical protein